MFFNVDVKPKFLGGPTTGSCISPSSIPGVYAECGMRMLGIRRLTAENSAGEEPILRVAAKIAEVRNLYVEKVFANYAKKTDMNG